MLTRNSMNTLSQTTEMLRTKGYTENFRMRKDGFMTNKSGVKLSPRDLKIRKVFRFEGNSNPDDLSILYAIETTVELKG